MKKISLLSIICLLAACTAGNKLLISEVNKKGNTDSIPDAVIRSLQQKNDIVLAFATENYAWGRSFNYSIICKNQDGWTGCKYQKKNMPDNNSANLSPVTVNTAACDSLLSYITANKIWEIKGETGEGGNRCPNGNENCNINDAANNRLWLITKERFIAPSYYAASFFEECCPGNKDRNLFLMTGLKLTGIVNNAVEDDDIKMEY